jgi:hypothetical protein
MFSNFHISMIFKRHQRASFIAMVVPLITFIIMLSVVFAIMLLFEEVFNEREDEFAAILTMTIYGQTSFMTFYIAIAIAVRKRFEAINVVLKREFSSSHNLIINSENNLKIISSHNLKTLSSLHAHLCEVISMLNMIFSLPIAFFFFTNLIDVVLSFYEGYAIAVSSKPPLANIAFLFQSFVIAVHNHVYVLAVLMTSTMMTSEGEMTTEILTKIRGEKELRKNFVVLRQQLGHSNVVFTCGMFEFDWTLMHAVSSN